MNRRKVSMPPSTSPESTLVDEPWQILEEKARTLTAQLIPLLRLIQKKVDKELVTLESLMKTFDE